MLAAEISRRKLGSVILVESGTKPTSRHLKVPVQYPYAFKSSHAWQYETIPQAGLAGRKIQLPAGKTLGGSSAINAMIYLRGHASDYQLWEQLVGPDWSPGNVAMAFQAMERSIGIGDALSADLHPATLEFLALVASGSLLPSLQPFIEPAIGIGAYTRCQRNGRRRSAWDLWSKGNFNPEATKSNIQLIQNASVQHLVMKRQKVVGLAIKTNDHAEPTTILSASKGVIVCAGTIQSPRLLLVSGIGDADELEAIGVPCQVDLPAVGKNLQDHLLFPVVRNLKRHGSLPSRMSDAERYAYARNRTGPMTSNIAEVGGFLSFSNQAIEDRNWTKKVPDFQWHVTPTHYLEYPTKPEPTAAISIAVSLCHPTSRGTVRLVPATRSDSSEQFELAIDPAYLASPDDLSRLLAAVQQTRSIFDGDSFLELVGDELLPGAKRQRDDQVATAIARFATTIYHYAGTCGMGSERTGVVDEKFRVRGVDGLWVCDASAMPRLVCCNTQATVMMMAYRLAEWLV